MYKFPVQAKRDLDQIRDYTLETWGADQAYVYLGRLRYGFESIEADPAVGKDRRELLAGMRSLAPLPASSKNLVTGFRVPRFGQTPQVVL